MGGNGSLTGNQTQAVVLKALKPSHYTTRNPQAVSLQHLIFFCVIYSIHNAWFLVRWAFLFVWFFLPSHLGLSTSPPWMSVVSNGALSLWNPSDAPAVRICNTCLSHCPRCLHWFQPGMVNVRIYWDMWLVSLWLWVMALSHPNQNYSHYISASQVLPF